MTERISDKHPISHDHVSLTDIFRLHRAGLLSEADTDHAVSLLRTTTDWYRWLAMQLLFCGVLLMLSGILYLLAFNWEQLGRFSRHSIMTLLFIGCSGYAVYAGTASVKGKIASFAAAVCSGAWLAVVGQIYQTGADAWQLFMGWMLLASLWIPLFRFPLNVVLCWLLLNMTLVLYWDQVLMPAHWATQNSLYLSVALLNGLALFGFNHLGGRWTWLNSPWIAWLLMIITMICLTIPAIAVTIDPMDADLFEYGLTLLWLIMLIVGYRYYADRDLWVVALLMISMLSVFLLGVGQVLIINDSMGSYWLFAVLVLGSFGGCGYWLTRLHPELAQLGDDRG